MGAIYSAFFPEKTEEQMTSPTEINTFTLENGLMTPSENQNHVQSLPSSPQPDETSQVDKINVIVKCAGRSMNMDVFPLESISVLLKDACELAGKNPEKMKLTFDGNFLDVNNTVSQYPNLRGGTTVNLIHAC